MAQLKFDCTALIHQLVVTEPVFCLRLTVELDALDVVAVLTEHIGSDAHCAVVVDGRVDIKNYGER